MLVWAFGTCTFLWICGRRHLQWQEGPHVILRASKQSAVKFPLASPHQEVFRACPIQYLKCHPQGVDLMSLKHCILVLKQPGFLRIRGDLLYSLD